MTCAAQASGIAKKGAAAAQQATTQQKADLIDINTASADQLKTIPGIGDEDVRKIVEI
jgi:DNA uptake protein ComE-like DNA-binding protein